MATQENNNRDELDVLIENEERRLRALPRDDPRTAQELSDFGQQVFVAYNTTRKANLLERSVSIGELVVDMLPPNSPLYPLMLENLAGKLLKRYETRSTIDDLNTAIQILCKSIGISPENLDLGIQGLSETTDSASRSAPTYGSQLNNLGLALRYRFDQTKSYKDLDLAIKCASMSVIAVPERSPDKVNILSNLGDYHRRRFEINGSMEDLQRSIHILRAVENVDTAEHKSSRLSNLGISLRHLFMAKGNLHDLEQAGLVTAKALSMTPQDGFYRADILNNYSAIFQELSAQTDSIDYLSESVRAAREAVEITPNGHLQRSNYLRNLATRLAHRSVVHTPTSARDFTDAIAFAKLAVDTAPWSDPTQALSASHLGGLHGVRALSPSIATDSDLEAATKYTLMAVEKADAYPLEKVQAGVLAVRFLAMSSKWKQAHDVALATIRYLPQLTLRSLVMSDKQAMFSKPAFLDFARDAAAIALNAQQDVLTALEFLELARGLLASSFEELRMEVDDLQLINPEMSKHFVDLQETLCSSSTSVSKRQEANHEFDRLIQEVRKLDGLETFMQLPSRAQLEDAARIGPLVVVNVSAYRCDAILIDSKHGIRSLLLDKLHLDDINRKVQCWDFGTPVTLAWLWDVLACPVLDALGFSSQLIGDDLQRVWWIPTGPLSKFPLHAAGHHLRNTSENLLDRVLSSYSSSVKSIVHDLHHRKKIPISSPPHEVVLVAMPNTPKRKSLRFADSEVQMLRGLLGTVNFKIAEPSKRKAEVLSKLLTTEIFHFAGHGSTNDTDPSKSRLLLQDWEDDPLTVDSLFPLNLRRRSPFLAYLSACGTGRVRKGKFLEESIHLISAFQVAGFRNVVGTLWEVYDDSCEEMARVTYEEIIKSQLTDGSVCKGLHRATRALRDKWKAETEAKRLKNSHLGEGRPGEMIFDLPSNSTVLNRFVDLEELPYWTPYVHYGI